MKVFLGNDEQWEELLAEEARLAAEALNMTDDATVDAADLAPLESLVDSVAVEDAFMSDEF